MAEVRIEVTCPGCQKAFLRPADEQGQIAECPNCGGWVDVPEVGRPPTTAEVNDAATARSAREYDLQLQENARQIAEAARLQEITARQSVQLQRSLDRRERQDEQMDELLQRLGRLLSRWEQLADQMGRAIEQLARRGPN